MPTATHNEPIIRVEHFTAAFKRNLIIDDISFDVKRGEVFVILGGSGSGKSTLLKHMIGLYTPAAGHIFIDGEDIVTAQGEARQNILRKNWSDVPTRGALRLDDST